METKWLQRFLNAGLLDIGDDDVKLDYLRKASDDLAEVLLRAPHEVPSHVLVALDPEIREDEPILADVERNVITHWKTLRGAFPDRPRQLLRAVILEAVDHLFRNEDPRFGAVTWLTGASFLPHTESSAGRRILEDFLRASGEEMETLTLQAWSFVADDVPRTPTPLIKAKDLPIGKVKRNALEKGIAAASGPRKQDGSTLKDPNPHWPNQGQNWAHEFSFRATTAIAAAIDGALENNLSEQAEVLQSLFRDHAKAIRAALKTAMIHAGETLQIAERRAMLLWWRETLYSPSIQTSYRDLKLQLVPFLMARDLASLTIPLTPWSVEFLLRESLRDVVLDPQNEMPELTIPDICRAAEDEHRELGVFSEAPNARGKGRVPLATYVQEVVTTAAEPNKDVFESLGISSETKIPLDELAVWLYRDLQAAALLRGENFQ